MSDFSRPVPSRKNFSTFFFFSSRRRHTRYIGDWSSDCALPIFRFISRDDSSNPKMAAEHTRDLVENEKVLLMFGSFGTPGNLATRSYLNENKVPQLFVASGDEE